MTVHVSEDLYPTRLPDVADVIERRHPTVWGTHADGPFDGAALSEHEARGYTVVEDFVTAQEVDDFSAELIRLSSDPDLRSDVRVITEKASGEVRSIFEVQKLSERIDALSRDARLLDRARQLLGSEVYLHQTRINYMPPFKGTGFYWHSDFETWHAEDGMPIPRAVSCSIALTDNFPYNGGLMVMPGSHASYVPSVGETPENYHQASLKEQTVGVPSQEAITQLAATYGIDQFVGPAGSALWFDSNLMHGSGNNITPFPRSNIFMVFNSAENTLTEPYAAPAPRPTHIANRDFTALR